jgi:hypothetical protein
MDLVVYLMTLSFSKAVERWLEQNELETMWQEAFFV